MSVGLILVFVVGVIVGLIVAWYPARLQTQEHQAETERLQATVKEKERSLEQLQADVIKREASAASLQEQLDQRDESIRDLNTEIEETRLAQEQFALLVQERDARIHDLQSRPLQAETRIGELEDALRERELGQQSLQSRLEEQEKNAVWLQDQLGQREETIRGLNALLDWRKLTINQMTEVLVKGDDPVAELKPPLTQLPEPEQKPDNLKRIEGIGPSIAKLLQEAGIATYAQLADTSVDRLQQVLSAAHLEMADPSTWPEQASLAATADWKTLTALQDELEGGRRVSQAG